MHDIQSHIPTVKGKDLLTLRAMLPYLWRHRWRTGLALLSLLMAKFAVVGVPLLLKHIVDALDASHNRELVLPLSLLLGYGALRLSGSLFNELRDTLFAKVRHGIVREVAGQVLAHLHALSLRFHLERKTGGLTRDIERGTTSMSNLLVYLLFNIVPTLVELGLVATILLSRYSAWFMIATVVTVSIYVALTFMITEWRMPLRAKMNAMDSRANAQAIDSLLNYETVKYFGNEDLRAAPLQRHAGALAGRRREEPDLDVLAEFRPGRGDRRRRHDDHDPGQPGRGEQDHDPGRSGAGQRLPAAAVRAAEFSRHRLQPD